MATVGDCPFLTVKKVLNPTDPFNPGNDVDIWDSAFPCFKRGSDAPDAVDGWWESEPPYQHPERVSIYKDGCGLIYKCCAFVIPVACRKKPCFFWNEDVEDCRLASVIIPKVKTPKAAIWAQEYMYNEDLDDDGRIYGKDWTLPVGSRPPALQNIPPKTFVIPAGVQVTEFKAEEAVKQETFKATVVNDQTGESAEMVITPNSTDLTVTWNTTDPRFS